MKKALLILMVVACSWGCGESDLELNILFDGEIPLEKGDRLLSADKQVGRVLKASNQNNDTTLVAVVIDQGFRENVTENSRFMVIADTRDVKKKAIDILQAGNGGSALKDGITVRGLSRTADQVWTSIEKGINFITKNIQKYTDELAEFTQGNEIEKLENIINGLLIQLKQSGDAAREK